MSNFSPIKAVKISWELGFCDGINLNACDATTSFHEESYFAGYAYAMDWLIRTQQNKQAFINITLFPEKYDWGYQKCLREI